MMNGPTVAISTKLRFNLSLHSYDILLLFDSVKFIDTNIHRFKISTIGVVDNFNQKRFRKASTYFRTLPQNKLGGATKWNTMYYLSPNLMSPRLRNIRRSVKHFIEWGGSGFVSPPNNEPLLQAGDLLDVNHIHQCIQIETRYDKALHLYQSLEIDKLCYIFGLPPSIHPVMKWADFNVVIPLHILDSLLLPNLNTDQCMRQGTMLQLPQAAIDPRGVWMESIQKWMPYKWFNEDSSAQGVAKNDDADIPIHYWNNRIYVLYPQCDNSTCDSFRKLLWIAFTQRLRHGLYNYSHSPELKADALVALQQRGEKEMVISGLVWT